MKIQTKIPIDTRKYNNIVTIMKDNLNKTNQINDVSGNAYTPNMLPYLIQNYFRENRLKISSHLNDMQIEEFLSKDSNNIEKTTKEEVKNSEGNISNLSNLLTQRDRIYYERGIKFNILICGQRGVGKTTILEKLFNIDLSINKEYSNYKEEIELRYNNSSNNIDNSIINNGIIIKLGITEISNFDNNKINNSFSWISIINEINKHNIQYYKERQRLHRNRKPSQDKKIHVCLYVMEPNQISAIDITTMKMVGQIITMIPIINKIDIISNTEELNRIKDKMQRLFKIYDITSFQNISSENDNLDPIFIHQDDNSDLKKMVIDKNMIELIDNDVVNDLNICNFERDQLNSFWWGENLFSKQINLQKKYRELIELQDKKFQEWIKMLIQKQKRCNSVIEQLLNRINLIRKECHILEDRLVTLHESNKYLSNKETTYTTHCNNSSKTLVVTNKASDSSDNNKDEYESQYSNNYNINLNQQRKNTNKNKNPIKNGHYLTENIRVMRY